MQPAATLSQPIAIAGRCESSPVEGAVAARDRAEGSIKPEKTDSKVGIHVARIVYGMMMDIVEPAGPREPRTKQRMTSHPKISQMHAVVQIAEHENGPGHQRNDRDNLV